MSHKHCFPPKDRYPSLTSIVFLLNEHHKYKYPSLTLLIAKHKNFLCWRFSCSLNVYHNKNNDDSNNDNNIDHNDDDDDDDDDDYNNSSDDNDDEDNDDDTTTTTTSNDDQSKFYNAIWHLRYPHSALHSQKGHTNASYALMCGHTWIFIFIHIDRSIHINI